MKCRLRAASIFFRFFEGRARASPVARLHSRGGHFRVLRVSLDGLRERETTRKLNEMALNQALSLRKKCPVSNRLITNTAILIES